MANTGSVGAVSPFGAETESKEIIVEADPLSAFLTDVAPMLVGGLVIIAFLAYQFGRWYLSRPRGEEVGIERPRVVKPVQPVVDDAEPSAQQMQRPWHAQ